jgi:hypothetical protein
MILTSEQHEALKKVETWLLNDNEPYFILTGAAGTGKTSLIIHLLDVIKIQLELWKLVGGIQVIDGIEITATTNKAVAVLQSSLPEYTVATIHSLLGLVITPNYKTGEDTLTQKDKHVRTNTLIIIDEASMIGSELWNFISDSTIKCKLLLIGDPYQLTPVKQKQSILDLLDCPKFELQEVQRHANNILSLGSEYKQAIETEIFPVPKTDLPQIQCITGPEFKDLIPLYFLKNEHNKILAWTNKKVIEYNMYIRNLRAYSELYEEQEMLITNKPIFTTTFSYPTDSEVMITKIIEKTTIFTVPGRWVLLNNYHQKLFLPDDPIAVKQQLKLFRKKGAWVPYFHIKNDWLDLRPIYASTVHKAQGSTYDTIFVDITDISKSTIKSITARLLYVAVTRAARKVYLYGTLSPRYY